MFIKIKDFTYINVNTIGGIDKQDIEGKYGTKRYTVNINTQSFSFDSKKERDEIYDKILTKSKPKKQRIISTIKRILKALEDDSGVT